MNKLLKVLWEKYKEISVPTILVPPPPKQFYQPNTPKPIFPPLKNQICPLAKKENTMTLTKDHSKVKHAPLSPLGLYEAIGELSRQVGNINMTIQHISDTGNLSVPAEVRDTDAKTKT